jgi:hypothetical protein
VQAQKNINQNGERLQALNFSIKKEEEIPCPSPPSLITIIIATTTTIMNLFMPSSYYGKKNPILKNENITKNM